jgi:signal transduction histidine kinase
MGNHEVADTESYATNNNRHAREPKGIGLPSPRALNLRDWSVSWRLLTVIILALVMGLVFGGLRVGAAANSAAQFGRVSQLASLGQQATSLLQALQDERDETCGIIPTNNPKAASVSLQSWYQATDAAAAKVGKLAAAINGSFPANIQARVAATISVIKHLSDLRTTAVSSQTALAVIASYATPIGDMLYLNQQIAQGAADSDLANDVQAFSWLSLAKDQAAQQRALLYNALTQRDFADFEQQALTTAVSEQAAYQTAFNATATPAEQSYFRNIVAGPLVNRAELIEDYIVSDGFLNTSVLNISPQAAPKVWYTAMSDTVSKMQQAELQLSSSIVARSQVLKAGAERSALFTALITALVLFLVLIAALAVARSLVRPLRRLQAGALDVATVQLPERVRQLSESQDPTTSLEVAPIDVLSTDEIGQVARAFDQVHAEAVRLAGNEAVLRRSFNAMFVNLSRRSQSLIERLARLIDSLEQNEQDSERLSSLFTMDHLVTRMRRNSENLLLLAEHESTRKWSEPVSIADVARAATSEIEQYNRVTLAIQPGVSVTGPAVTDVVHLLAEIVENATTFSPKDTPVHLTAQELSSGGVLIEVTDSGVGIPDARLADLNYRLDNPPVMDVSVSRHMGLYAVAHLAQRHGIRVRLRARAPRGLTALIWLPESITERSEVPYGRRPRPVPQPETPAKATIGAHRADRRQTVAVPPAAPLAAELPSFGRPPVETPAAYEPVAAAAPQTASAARERVPAAATAGSKWFRIPPAANGAAVGSGDGRGEQATAPLPQPDRESLGTRGLSEGKHAAEVITNPVHGEQTAAGLPVRIPRANLLPGSAGGARRTADAAPEGQATQPPAARRPQQSPDKARNRLSGFQSGSRRAKGDAPVQEREPIGELCLPPRPELARLGLHYASRGCGARDRGLRRRRGPCAVGVRPAGLRRPARGHHLRPGQPDARRVADLRRRPADAGPGGDGGRADVHHGHQRRVQPGRAGLPRVRRGSGLLRDDPPGRGRRRHANPRRPRPARNPQMRLARVAGGVQVYGLGAIRPRGSRKV